MPRQGQRCLQDVEKAATKKITGCGEGSAETYILFKGSVKEVCLISRRELRKMGAVIQYDNDTYLFLFDTEFSHV